MRPRVILVFLDGVGIGHADTKHNPFFAADYPVLKKLCDGTMLQSRNARRTSQTSSVVPINATLGVEGLPQSGTGQTALMTGVNASKIIGKHFGPYPYSTLHPVIEEKSIFRRLRESGHTPYYANAFPKKYFDFIEAKRGRTPTIARAWRSAGYELNTSDALKAGGALSADITNERWNANGFAHVPVISAGEGGSRVAEISRQHDFVMYEFPFTDHAGHSQSMTQAVSVLELIDAFIGGICSAIDMASTTLLITSDHGNLEDLSTKSHTRNPVPFIAVGRHHAAASRRAESLTDVPEVIEYLLKPG